MIALSIFSVCVCVCVCSLTPLTGEQGHSMSPVTPSELLIALHNIDCKNDEATLKAVVRGGEDRDRKDDLTLFSFLSPSSSSSSSH